MWRYSNVLSKQRCAEWHGYVRQRWVPQHINADGSTAITHNTCQRMWLESDTLSKICQLHSDYAFVPWGMVVITPVPTHGATALTPWVCDDSVLLWILLPLTNITMHFRKRELTEPCIYWQYSSPVVQIDGVNRCHHTQVSLHQCHDNTHAIQLTAGDAVVLSTDCYNWRCYQQDNEWHEMLVLCGYKKS